MRPFFGIGGALGGLVAVAHASPLPEGFELLDSMDDGQLQAALVRHPDGAVVCHVPGTNQPADAPPMRLVVDLDVRTEELMGAEVHAGFLHDARKLLTWLADHPAPQGFCGHSMGGAVAQVAGFARGLPSLAVAPARPFHGPPPPLDAALSVVDPADPIPRLPSPRWSLGGVVLVLPQSGRGYRPRSHLLDSMIDAVDAAGIGWLPAPWEQPPS